MEAEFREKIRYYPPGFEVKEWHAQMHANDLWKLKDIKKKILP